MDILSVAEMYRADELAVNSGITGIQLMGAAGRAVADAVIARWPVTTVFILCGPGNNGGDGFVAARYLADAGWPVHLYLLGQMENLTGDALHHAQAWQSKTGAAVQHLDAFEIKPENIVIDALFGAGLTRAIEGDLAALFQRIGDGGCSIVAVDLPSGVSGDSGEILGTALKADLTVTFFRKKFAHVLYPGAGIMGDLIVSDIGIPESVLDMIKSAARENSPQIWRKHYPVPDSQGHKYTRGHALIVGGEKMTGAARLAARAARRIGAGLSTIATTPAAFPLYAAGDPGTIVDAYDDTTAFEVLLSDKRKNAVLVGPGTGLTSATRDLAVTALASEKSIVLDADGLTIFQDDPHALFEAIKSPCVLTPHEGEFDRLFNHEGDKVSRTRSAARECGAVVLLKGPDTVIAAPDGEVVINTNAVPDLATAGAGDVLAGIIVGLMAQGMCAFDAAAAGAWVHGAASARIGAGLIAEDLCEQLPYIIKDIRAN